MNVTMSILPPPRVRFMLGAFASVVILTLIWLWPSVQTRRAASTEEGLAITSHDITEHSPPRKDPALIQLLHSISTTSEYFVNYPLPPSEFGKMGKRLQVLQDWIAASENHRITAEQAEFLRDRVDKTAISLFPYLRVPNQASDTSLSHLRQRFEPGTKGIVIPTGQKTFRYACHLIGNLRDILGSKLPIEIVYAGDSDLPSEYRDFITQLSSNITTMDITQVFDDTTLDLPHGGWAIKSFAALASRYEQVLLLDADAVFLQAPEAILDHHNGYRTTGALLFHDRLLWQGAFKERHEWWEKQLEHQTPSQALSKSLVYNEGYAEECDAGLVVLDKSKLHVLLGMLHVCWQNTKLVREEWTYNMGYGDKESWWFGLELSGAEYSFEDHYGGMLGALNDDGSRVCSFTIAHVDEHDKLMWYNGSLLKNKLVNATAFEIPTHWMMDGIWEKGATKPDFSCMKGAKIRETSEEVKEIIRDSVDRARDIDERIHGFISLK